MSRKHDREDDSDEMRDVSRRLLMTLAGSMDIDDVVGCLRASLCDYNRRMLAMGLIFPLDGHVCEHDHDADRDAVHIERAVLQ
jgi:hypothetical protein